MLAEIYEKNTVILNQLSSSRKEYVGFCRFVSNPRVTLEALVSSIVNKTSELVADEDILVINDTTEFSFQHYKNLYSDDDPDLGPITYDKHLGFFLHPGYVLEAHTGIGLGFSYVKLWNRIDDHPSKYERNYQNQPTIEKESYRWIECAQRSKEKLQKAKHITIIADRESDLYEEFAKVPDSKTDLIIRRCRERKLYDEGIFLSQKLSQMSVQTIITLPLKKNRKRKQREAVIEISYEKIKIKRPNRAARDLPGYLEVFVVQAKEQVENVPKGEDPINWSLLTSREITDIEDAKDVINKYKQRWEIELLFGTMKTKGLNVELSQLETGKSLKCLCIFALIGALRIMQLKQARHTGEGINAEVAFTLQEIKVLTVLNNRYEGNTIKQKNPYKSDSLAWAAWIIARMGGWKGDMHKTPPGFKSFTIGLVQFDKIIEGINLADEICA